MTISGAQRDEELGHDYPVTRFLYKLQPSPRRQETDHNQERKADGHFWINLYERDLQSHVGSMPNSLAPKTKPLSR